MSNQYNYKFWESRREANAQKRREEAFDAQQDRLLNTLHPIQFPPTQDVEQRDITSNSETTQNTETTVLSQKPAVILEEEQPAVRTLDYLATETDELRGI
jgi:hypothetical protein